MSLTKSVEVLYLLSASMLCMVAVHQLYTGASMVFTPTALVAAAAYCVLVAVLLLISQGQLASVFVVAAIAIWIGYILRAFFMLLGSSWYSFPFRNVLQLESWQLTEAFAFMSLGTLAWYVGAALACRRGSFVGASPMNEAAYRQSGLLVIIGLVVLSVFWAARIFGGVGLDVEMTANYGFLTRFLPVDALFLIMMYLIVRHWQALPRAHRIGVASYVVIYLLGQIGLGARSAILQPIILVLLTVALTNATRSVDASKLLRAGLVLLLVLLAFPFWLGLAMYLRGLVRFSDIAAARGVAPELIMVGFGYAYRAITNRFPGLDNLVVVMQHRPFELDQYLTPWITVQAIIASTIPDRLIDLQAYPAGKVFGSLYQGLPWEFPHHGAFLGFGIFFAYGEWWGTLLMGAFAYLTVRAMAAASRTRLFAGWLPLYILLNLIWGGFLSGNFDVLIATLLTQSLVIAAYIKFGQWLRDRLSEPMTADLRQGLGTPLIAHTT